MSITISKARSIERVSGLDLRAIRAEFPILEQKINGQPLVYLDNAATTQKPRIVLDALARYYTEDNSNVHRGVHLLSQRATREYEEARVKIQKFLNAAGPEEIIFTRGATEAINLVASSFGRKFVHSGDEIIISHMEHHSNIVPWQMLCEERGATLRVVPINERGEFDFAEFEKLLSPRTRLVSVVHLSNSLGSINPVKAIIAKAHERGASVLIDGAQAISHIPVDVQDLDCDFYAFSGHKLYGPTGIGALYGKKALLDAMPPYQGGGDMISSVRFEKTTYAELPSKFEAGTPHIAGAVGLGTAIDYVQSLGLGHIRAHEDALLRHATKLVSEIPGVRILGTASEKAAVLSFVVENPPLSALDVGAQLDLEGFAVRTGHHCCQPVMDRFGIPATARISFAVYNTIAEVDAFAAALKRIVTMAARNRPATPAPLSDEIAYAPTSAASPEEAADEMVEVFSMLGDWTERYGYLIELGGKLPFMPPALKTETNRVHGCQSTVYLSARARPGADGVLEFLADSDADLVRGLIALLERVFSGQPAEKVLAFDVEGFFARLGLDQHLTMGRRNGLAAMVHRIRNLAALLAGVRPAAVKAP